MQEGKSTMVLSGKALRLAALEQGGFVRSDLESDRRFPHREPQKWELAAYALRWGRPAGLDVRPGDFSSLLADSRATEAKRCPVRFSIGASSVCAHRGGRS